MAIVRLIVTKAESYSVRSLKQQWCRQQLLFERFMQVQELGGLHQPNGMSPANALLPPGTLHVLAPEALPRCVWLTSCYKEG
jgi:hypothetical protein